MVLRLCDAGETVVVLDNLTTGFDWAIDPAATLVQGNAGDMELVGKLIAEHHITEIVHFAGSIVVPESVTNPLKYYANNTATSRNLIEAAVTGGVKHFIFSSTAAVYGMTGLEPVSEDTPLIADVALWPHQADDRDDAGRRRGGASASPTACCAISTSPAPIRRSGQRPVDAARDAPDQGRRRRRRSASATMSISSAPTIRRRTAPACATTSTSPT